MALKNWAGFQAKHAALWVALALAVLGLILAALGFLVAALYLALAQPLGAAGAAALTGALLLMLALLVLAAGGAILAVWRRRPPRLAPSLTESAFGLLSAIVRNDPKKALLLAALAGALTEFLAGGEE